MNFGATCFLCERWTIGVPRVWGAVVLVGFIFILGCSDNVTLPTPQELAEFEKAGPISPELDLDQLVQSQGGVRDYRIENDDLLKITLPSALVQVPGFPVQSIQFTYDHLSRVDLDGKITLPLVESIPAKGLTLQEVEAEIVKAYYPKYTSKVPPIVVQVERYHPCLVTITGAVKKPGVYELAGHKMTLVSAIMAADGILETGAASIRIRQPGEAEGRKNSAPPVSAAPAPDASPEKTPPSSNLRMTFSQAHASGVGEIRIKDGPKVVYAEHLDVTDPQQRQSFSDRIATAYPQLSSEYVSTRLSELTQVIGPDSVSSDFSADNVQPPAPSEPADGRTFSLDELGSQPLLLPVKGMYIPFSDIALQNGTTIEVETLKPQVFTVVGLVLKAGAFPYPPGARYTLADALGFAGGVDELINPRYVRVYRRTPEGTIVDAVFPLKGPTSAAPTWIKPGDVIAVEQTARTRTNLILSRIFSLNFGGYYNFNPNQ